MSGLHGLMPSELITARLEDAPSTRRCGRCLQQFPGDPDADAGVIPEFWMCPACREALLGKVAHAVRSPAVRRAW